MKTMGILLAEVKPPMMTLLARKVFFFWILIMTTFGFFRFSHAEIPGVHGGTVIQSRGRSFEVVRDPSLPLVRVYTKPEYGPNLDAMTLYLKSKNRTLEHVHLRLSSSTPDALIYTGLISSNVLVRGGIEFEIKPKK